MTAVSAAFEMINEYETHVISNETRDEIMSTFSALTEIYSVISEQNVITEVIVIEKDATDDHASELFYLIDVSTSDDCADIRAKLDCEHVLSLKLDTMQQVRSLLASIANSLSF
jgi:hypothetical protein